MSMTKVDESIVPSNDRSEKKNQPPTFFDRLDNLKIAHKGIILVAVPMITGLVSVSILLYLLNQSEQELAREERAAQINATTSALNQVWLEIVYAAGTYVYTEEESYRERFYKGAKKSKLLLGQLSEQIASLPEKVVPEELEALDKFRKLETQIEKTIERVMIVTTTTHENIAYARSAREEMMTMAEQFTSQLFAFQKRIEEIEAQHSKDPAKTRAQARALVIVFGILTIIISIYLAVFYSRSITRRLEVVTNNSISLASHSPLQSRLRGREEIARLDQVFHKMADALDEASQKERAITDNAADVICTIDSALNFKELNPACLSSWGYNQKSLIGKNVIDLVTEDDKVRTSIEFKHAMETGNETTIDNRILKSSGETAHMHWSLHWSNDGATFYCIAHDATEQYELERLKKEFVAMVSHDLRSPLSALQGALSLFERGAYGTLNEKGKTTIERSHDDLSRLIGLIDSLLDLDKMESGKMQMEFSEIDLSSVASRSVNAVAHLAQNEKITLETDSHPLLCEGDDVKLVQVMVNLLSNALKFSSAGDTINITYKIVDSWAEVKVNDQGRGIPASRISAIFDRFEQVADTDHSEKGGRGLGLAICKSIVEAHSGSIGVESEEGKGSTFWFRIPRKQSDEVGFDANTT